MKVIFHVLIFATLFHNAMAMYNDCYNLQRWSGFDVIADEHWSTGDEPEVVMENADGFSCRNYEGFYPFVNNFWSQPGNGYYYPGRDSVTSNTGFPLQCCKRSSDYNMEQCGSQYTCRPGTSVDTSSLYYTWQEAAYNFQISCCVEATTCSQAQSSNTCASPTVYNSENAAVTTTDFQTDCCINPTCSEAQSSNTCTSPTVYNSAHDDLRTADFQTDCCIYPTCSEAQSNNICATPTYYNLANASVTITDFQTDCCIAPTCLESQNSNSCPSPTEYNSDNDNVRTTDFQEDCCALPTCADSNEVCSGGSNLYDNANELVLLPDDDFQSMCCECVAGRITSDNRMVHETAFGNGCTTIDPNDVQHIQQAITDKNRPIVEHAHCRLN